MSFKATNTQLAAFAEKCQADGVRYWYGTCYYKCTRALLTSKSHQYPEHYGSNRQKTYQAAIDAGAMCADCVGLIKGAVWSELGTRATKYGTNGCPDKSADGMLKYCKSKGQPHGDMSTFPDTPGLLLHKSGHVGISIGGGFAIESRGFAYGVVRTRVAERGWTSWARLPFIDYGDGEGSGSSDTGTSSDAVADTPAPAPAGYKLGDRTLRRGMKGPDVAELQAALVSIGYDCGTFGAARDGIDGSFGSATQTAVETLQAEAGIKVDGIFGPASHTALLTFQRLGGRPKEEPPDTGGEIAITYTVTIPSVDAATATYLLDSYHGATAEMDVVNRE